MVEQNIAQHFGVTRGQGVVNGFAREALRHPAFCRRTVNFRQLNRQLPLAALAQETAKQRVITEPFAGVIHPLQEKPLPLDLFQPHLTIFFAGYTYNQRIVH